MARSGKRSLRRADTRTAARAAWTAAPRGIGNTSATTPATRASTWCASNWIATPSRAPSRPTRQISPHRRTASPARRQSARWPRAAQRLHPRAPQSPWNCGPGPALSMTRRPGLPGPPQRASRCALAIATRSGEPRSGQPIRWQRRCCPPCSSRSRRSPSPRGGEPWLRSTTRLWSGHRVLSGTRRPTREPRCCASAGIWIASSPARGMTGSVSCGWPYGRAISGRTAGTPTGRPCVPALRGTPR